MTDRYHKNQLSTPRVGALQLCINHHNILFKGKNDEKARVVKIHIGSKILTSIVQEKQTLTQIQSLTVTVIADLSTLKH